MKDQKVSIKELIIDQCIFADVSFDEKCIDKIEDLFKDDSHQKGIIDVSSGLVKYVYKIDKVEQKEEVMSRQKNVAKFIPLILKENRQFTNSVHVCRAISQFFQ